MLIENYLYFLWIKYKIKYFTLHHSTNACQKVATLQIFFRYHYNIFQATMIMYVSMNVDFSHLKTRSFIHGFLLTTLEKDTILQGRY